LIDKTYDFGLEIETVSFLRILKEKWSRTGDNLILECVLDSVLSDYTRMHSARWLNGTVSLSIHLPDTSVRCVNYLSCVSYWWTEQARDWSTRTGLSW